MSEYLIVPYPSIDEAYTAIYPSLQDAQVAASGLSLNHGTDIKIYELVGEQQIKTIWKDAK